LQKAKTKEEKKNRLKRKFLLLTNDEAKANKERANRAGTHKSGVNMAEGNVDGYTIEDLKMAAALSNSRPKNNRKNTVCPHCGRKGHSTMRSKQCLHHNGPPIGIPGAAAEAVPEDDDEDDAITRTDPVAMAARNSLAQAIRDMDNYDSYPLTNDYPSDISLWAFQDAGTWSDDDEDEHAVGEL
jgi:hypothetical protein